MAARKRVLLTVGPGLVAGKRHTTQRSIVTALHDRADLRVVPVDGYNWTDERVRAYKRTRGGSFEDLGMIVPAADLWIVYSDGYYLDHRALGFRRRDFFRALLAFHQRGIDSGRIGRVVNAPCVEARTLKSWFATLDAEEYRLIPTYRFSAIDEVHDFQRQRRSIVAKLDWGGGGNGAQRLLSEEDVRRFAAELRNDDDRDLDDYCFQPYLPGDEKRFWFVGGDFVAGRKSHGRPTPWSDSTDDYAVHPYDDDDGEEFRSDLAAASRLCRVAGLEVGSIDFIGKRINEINGCGTIFTEYKFWQCIVDARPALTRYFLDLVSSQPIGAGGRDTACAVHPPPTGCAIKPSR